MNFNYQHLFELFLIRSNIGSPHLLTSCSMPFQSNSGTGKWDSWIILKFATVAVAHGRMIASQELGNWHTFSMITVSHSCLIAVKFQEVHSMGKHQEFVSDSPMSLHLMTMGDLVHNSSKNWYHKLGTLMRCFTLWPCCLLSCCFLT